MVHHLQHILCQIIASNPQKCIERYFQWWKILFFTFFLYMSAIFRYLYLSISILCYFTPQHSEGNNVLFIPRQMDIFQMYKENSCQSMYKMLQKYILDMGEKWNWPRYSWRWQHWQWHSIVKDLLCCLNKLILTCRLIELTTGCQEEVELFLIWECRLNCNLFRLHLTPAKEVRGFTSVWMHEDVCGHAYHRLYIMQWVKKALVERATGVKLCVWSCSSILVQRKDLDRKVKTFFTGLSEVFDLLLITN